MHRPLLEQELELALALEQHLLEVGDNTLGDIVGMLVVALDTQLARAVVGKLLVVGMFLVDMFLEDMYQEEGVHHSS